jgi:hypothetical protein
MLQLTNEIDIVSVKARESLLVLRQQRYYLPGS